MNRSDTDQNPTGWNLVRAQTREDETGVMTLPLTGHGLPEDRSMAVTDPAAATAAAAEMEADEPGWLARYEALLQLTAQSERIAAFEAGC